LNAAFSRPSVRSTLSPRNRRARPGSPRRAARAAREGGVADTFDRGVRGGTVVDGTGSPGREADVAIAGGRVVEVGRVAGSGRAEIDARGFLVTPGFVDIHTHYDGQATWDGRLTPSSWHGVTTVVMGNCGVGFAPCKPDDH